MGSKTSAMNRLPGADPAPDRPAARLAEQREESATLSPIGFVRNRKSHRNKGHDEVIRDFPSLTMVEPATKPELEAALARFAERGIGLLAISGGDGTVREVLTRGAPLFEDSWPAIIVLPQGKTNALALDLGIPSRWTLADAIESARKGRFVTRRPLIVRQLDGEQRSRYGFIFGAGVFNTAIEAGQVAHKHGAFQSFAVGMTAAFGIMQALFGFGQSPWRKLSRMQIAASPSGTELPRSEHGRPESRFLAGFTTLSRFPLGLKPFVRTGEDAEIRYFLLDAPLRRTVALLPAVVMGWDSGILSGLGLHRGAVAEMQIDLEDGFVLDGEKFSSGSYLVRMGPEMRFAVP